MFVVGTTPTRNRFVWLTEDRLNTAARLRKALKSQSLGRLFISAVAAATLLVGPQTLAQTITQGAEYVPGEIIVKLKKKSKSMEAQAFIGKAVSEKSMTLKGSWGGINLHHFALKPGQSVESAIADLKADPEVEYVEPNYIVHRQSAGVEGQPVAMSEVHEASASGNNTTFSQTSAPIQTSDAWANETPGLAAPVVAVIDTGLDLTHDVFVQSGAIWTNTHEIAANGIDDDGNGYIDDVHGWNFVANTNSPQDDDGHGTHVSGIILGTTQDITASPITAAKIRIMPLKFLDANGSGSTADAVKAIYYAVNNGAKVLNNSWGGGGYSSSLLDAIAYAYDKKVIFVAAAGNASGNNDSSPTYPANYSVPSLISVAATSDLDALASFSNFGQQTVHMGSPGVSIWSTFPGNMFGRSSGTSMATPFVSGVAALIVREAPTMTGYQAKSVIFSGAQSISSLQVKTITKARLNAYNSLMSAKGIAVDSNQPAYAAAASRDPAGSADASPAGCGLVAKTIYDSGEGGGPTSPLKNLAFFGLLLVLVSPILVSMVLRSRDGRNRRRHTRYQIDSAVTLKFGDRELVGQVSTISLGGIQLNTDAWLEQGGIVKMQISSPDGKDQIEVDGHIVWSEEKKRYGVAFDHADNSIRSKISAWTKSLLRA
jgi:subtilisin family serine protease